MSMYYVHFELKLHKLSLDNECLQREFKVHIMHAHMWVLKALQREGKTFNQLHTL